MLPPLEARNFQIRGTTVFELPLAAFQRTRILPSLIEPLDDLGQQTLLRLESVLNDAGHPDPGAGLLEFEPLRRSGWVFVMASETPEVARGFAHNVYYYANTGIVTIGLRQISLCFKDVEIGEAE